ARGKAAGASRSWHDRPAPLPASESLRAVGLFELELGLPALGVLEGAVHDVDNSDPRYCEICEKQGQKHHQACRGRHLDFDIVSAPASHESTGGDKNDVQNESFHGVFSARALAVQGSSDLRARELRLMPPHSS